MSKAQLEKFVSFVAKNPAVLGEAEKGAKDQDTLLKAVHRYAKEKGYDFAIEEGQAWIADYSNAAAMEAAV